MTRGQLLVATSSGQGYADADATAGAQSGCGVEAEALQPVTREMVAALKLGEEHKQKSYVATCRLSAPPDPERLAALNASTDILVRTRASQRVLAVMNPLTMQEVSLPMNRSSRTIFEQLPGIQLQHSNPSCKIVTHKSWSLRPIQVEQQTPTRVAQRRADLVRKRLVHSISCEMTEVSLRGAEISLLRDLRQR